MKNEYCFNNKFNIFLTFNGGKYTRTMKQKIKLNQIINDKRSNSPDSSYIWKNGKLRDMEQKQNKE